jgi:hypothetical protein
MPNRVSEPPQCSGSELYRRPNTDLCQTTGAQLIKGFIDGFRDERNRGSATAWTEEVGGRTNRPDEHG